MFVFAVSMRRLITFSSGKPSSAFQPTNKAKLMLLIIRGKNFLLGQTTNQLNNWLESPRWSTVTLSTRVETRKGASMLPTVTVNR